MRKQEFERWMDSLREEEIKRDKNKRSDSIFISVVVLLFVIASDVLAWLMLLNLQFIASALFLLSGAWMTLWNLNRK